VGRTSDACPLWTARAHKSESYIDRIEFKNKVIGMEVLCRAKQTR
jgi:hypothetical protein